MEQRDLVVLGGGAGGLTISSVAAQLGLKVTLIEKEQKLGGDCLHYGCVPSKTLIKSAKVASLMRRASDFGLENVEANINLEKISKHVQSVVEHIQQHDDPERFRSYGCEVLFGNANFLDSHSIQINNQIIKSKRFVIATGSRSFIPNIKGLSDIDYLTNVDIFSLKELPKHLVILGAGAIGVEMGQAFNRLGSKVTILQRADRILPLDEKELTDELKKVLIDEGIQIQTNTEAVNIYMNEKIINIKCSNGKTIEADKILVATGRQANVENLNLDRAGVNYSNKGISVDNRMRTSAKHIYACGDVCGPYRFTHMAEYQAGIVISNAIFRFPKKTNYRVVPWVTYTEPEMAHVGLTEQQALDKKLDINVLRFAFKDNDRALAEVETEGATKFITHKGKIIGASILGAHAGELIHEIVLAMQTGAKISDISAAVHAYPTLAQIHRRTVNTAYAPKLFSAKTRWVVKWLNRLLP